MALRNSLPKILVLCLTWNNHWLVKALLIFLSNDLRASSSTRRLSSNFLVLISVVLRNSSSLYWSPIPRRFQINCTPNSYLSIQAMCTLFMFWESSLHLMECQQKWLKISSGWREANWNKCYVVWFIPHFAHASFIRSKSLGPVLSQSTRLDRRNGFIFGLDVKGWKHEKQLLILPVDSFILFVPT